MPAPTEFFFHHYSDMAPDDLESFKQRWPSFSPRELASKGEGELLIHAPTLDALQRVRDRLGIPVNVTSYYRSKSHNRSVGGVKNSKHLEGIAADISMSNHDPEEFERIAREEGFKGIGHYPPPRNFMHIDTRETPAFWSKGGVFKTGATKLPVEAPETIQLSPTEKIGGATGLVIAVRELFAQFGLDMQSVDWRLISYVVGALAIIYFLRRYLKDRDLDI